MSRQCLVNDMSTQICLSTRANRAQINMSICPDKTLLLTCRQMILLVDKSSRYKGYQFIGPKCWYMGLLVVSITSGHSWQWLIRQPQHHVTPPILQTENFLCFTWPFFKHDGHQNDVFIMDFSKAFDKVGHQRLVSKLQGYGITGQTHRWVQQWLHCRTQVVVVDAG